MKLRTLFNKLKPPLRDSEREIIDAIAEELSSEASRLLTSQVAAVNYVQRHAGGTEINLYCMRGNKAEFDEKILFPNRAEELRLAFVKFIQSHGGVNNATAWVCNGHIFSIELSRPLSSAGDVRITNVTILSDPTSSEVVEWKEAKINSWISKKLSGKIFSRPPIGELPDAQQIKESLQGMPSDYLAIIDKNNGVVSDSLVILGGDQLRKVRTQDVEYTIFAELPNKGVFAIRQSDKNEDVWFIDFEDNSPTCVGGTFEDALDQAL